MALILEKKFAQRVHNLAPMVFQVWPKSHSSRGSPCMVMERQGHRRQPLRCGWSLPAERCEYLKVTPWNSPPHPSFWQRPTNTQTPFHKWGGINQKQSKNLLLQAAKDQHPTVGNIATIQPIRPRLLLGEFLFVLPFQLNLSQIDFILSRGRWESKYV